MRTARMGQAVLLMLIVAIAASCAATKEYSSKLFPTRETGVKQSQPTALRFLDLENAEPDKANWVTTDIITGRDTMAGRTAALENLSKVFPSANKPIDSVKTQVKTSPEVIAVKPAPVESEPVARTLNPGEIRTKRSRE